MTRKSKQYHKDYYQKNKNRIKKYAKKYRKKYYLTHKKQIKDYLLKNKDKIRKKTNIYLRNRRKTNVNCRLASYLRHRIYMALKQNSKGGHTIELVGCSIGMLKEYLQNRFKQGMSWLNYRQWHIDHIKPCASFNLSKPSEQRICFHFTNPQPLWARDNFRKHDKIIKSKEK